MAWQRVVTQHRCAPVSVGGTRCSFRAQSRGWRGLQKLRSRYCAVPDRSPDPTGPAILWGGASLGGR
eukprot:5261277-Prymnesium_polylepis.1